MAGHPLPSPSMIQRPPAPAPAVRWRAVRLSDASMLSVIDRKGRVVGRLGPDDRDAMLAAFAYSGATAQARTRGADVVRTAQQRDCWFHCDCLGPGEPAPVLVPVTETHIRRSPHHRPHADGCPFEMNAAEREGHAASLRKLEPGECFQLARAIGQPRFGTRARNRKQTMARLRTESKPAGACAPPIANGASCRSCCSSCCPTPGCTRSAAGRGATWTSKRPSTRRHAPSRSART